MSISVLPNQFSDLEFYFKRKEKTLQNPREPMVCSPLDSLRLFTNTALLESFNSQISTNRRKLPSKTRSVKENKNLPKQNHDVLLGGRI